MDDFYVCITGQQLEVFRRILLIAAFYNNYDEINMHLIYQIIENHAESLKPLNITKEEADKFFAEYIFLNEYKEFGNNNGKSK